MTNPAANKKQLPAFLVLTIIAVIAAIALAVTNEVTKGPIAENAARERNKAFAAVLPAASYNELTVPEGHGSVSSLFEAVDENGAAAGYTIVASASGYAGPVAVTLGVGPDGMVTGAVIGDTSFAETAGFGMRWKEETDRWEQFKQIDTANGGSIEAITGATVTSGAVLSATNAVVNCINEVRGVAARDVVTKGTPAAKPIEQMTLTGGIHEGSAKGFASDVRVQLTMDDANVVTGLVIDSSGETAGFGTRAMEEPAFAEQFVGKTAPFELGKNIDALTGATVTSTAVVAAVNAACESPVNPDAVPFDLGGGEEEPAVEASAEPAPEGALTASAKGLLSDVKVTITLAEDGTIATMVVDASGETAAIAGPCTEEAFLSNFVGKKGPFEGVEVVTGATYTSNAVINAVNSLFPAEEATNELTASAKGLLSDVKVTITLAEDGTIATMTVDASGETAAIAGPCTEEAFLSNFVGKKGPFEGVEVVTGATYTSNAVINAVNSLFPAEEATNELTASAKGLLSDVKVTITLAEDGTIATMAVDCSGETAAIAGPCAEEAFLSNFVGKKGPFEGVEVVTGATYTSNAVINAVNSLFPAEEATNELTASAKGLLSDVKVTITLNEDDTIATMVVDASGETAAIAGPCTEEAFLSNFVGKKGPFEGVEVVTGATYTSNAVINAVNSLFPAEEATNELTASAKGLLSDVKVTITLAEDGTIATMAVDCSGETAAIAGPCTEEAFLSNFVGKKGPFEGVEVVTGATYTSNAVINAVNSLFPAEEAANELTASAKGLLSDVKVTITLAEDGTIATMTVDASGETAAIAGPCTEEAFLSNFIGKKGPFEGVEVVTGATYTSNAVINAVNSLFPAEEAANELTASAKGLLSDVKVTITLAEDGTIATMTVDASGETAAIAGPCTEEAFLSNFVGKKGPFEGVEVVTGATYTSNAVINAVNSLFPAEEAANELTASAKGLLSDVKVTITLAEDGTIATMAVDASGETAAIAGPCTEEAFLSNFVGKKGPFEGVEVVTGATYTSNAVINAVNSLFPAEEATNELTASAKGLLSDVKVTITLAEDGTIATMTVDASGETAAIAGPCTEEAFLSNFVGKKGPFEGVEVVTGATYTSNAVINAVNSLFPAEEATNELTASAKGLLSDVKVTITLAEDGTIATMTVDASGETAAIAGPCTEEAFLSNFVGKKGPFEGVEVVTGATYTSNAVINAVNSLFPAE